MSKVGTRGVDKTCSRDVTMKKVHKSQSNSPYNEKQLSGVFRRFDTDHDGCLNRKDLINAFQSLGSHFPAWRAWRALHHADLNKDGLISENEFLQLAKYAAKNGFVLGWVTQGRSNKYHVDYFYSQIGVLYI